MKHSDTGDTGDRGEMTDEQLDQLLTAANSELLEHIEATANPTQVLSAITRGDRQDHPAGPGGPPTSHDPGLSPAAAMISHRIRARSLVLDLDLAYDRASDLTLTLDLDLARASERDLARASDRDLTLASARTSALALTRALTSARASARNLTYGLLEDARTSAHASDLLAALGLASILARGLNSVRDLARDLTRALTLDRALDRAREIDLNLDPGSELRVLRARAREIAEPLNELQVDASDADLSDVEIRQLDPLDGVIWTRGTTWPADVAAQVEAHSEEIRPGVYQVRLGNTRDRDPLARP